MKKLLLLILLTPIVIGCGGISVEKTVHASAPITTTTILTNPDGQQLNATWTVLIDGNKFVALGSATQDCTPRCIGVPNGTGWFLPPIPNINSYCVTGMKLGTKQPSNTEQSYIVMSIEQGYGKPSVSVRSDDGMINLPPICFPTEHGLPQYWIANNWSSYQVMTFVVSGELR